MKADIQDAKTSPQKRKQEYFFIFNGAKKYKGNCITPRNSKNTTVSLTELYSNLGCYKRKAPPL